MKNAVITSLIILAASPACAAQDATPSITVCPGPKNMTVPCSGTNCFGMVSTGGCGGTNTSGHKCTTNKTPCCGKDFTFGEDSSQNCGTIAACVQPPAKAVGARLLLSAKGPHHFLMPVFVLSREGVKPAEQASGGTHAEARRSNGSSL